MYYIANINNHFLYYIFNTIVKVMLLDKIVCVLSYLLLIYQC